MQSPEELKSIVREKYSEIADQPREQNAGSCCGVGSCCQDETTVFSVDYGNLAGYAKDADLGLGCGIPTEFAKIRGGDTVVDLGSGAGNDVFVARSFTGDKGRVIGVDMTAAMITKARANNSRLGYTNVEFRLGEIENLPVGDNTADVVLSNCVLNLVPDKKKAFAEVFRILKPGSHFSISDIVIRGTLPPEIRNAAELYAGCVAGAIETEAYLALIRDAGFMDVEVVREREAPLPPAIIEKYLTPAQRAEYNNSGSSMVSVTVYGKKPESSGAIFESSLSAPEKRCCPPGSGCC